VCCSLPTGERLAHKKGRGYFGVIRVFSEIFRDYFGIIPGLFRIQCRPKTGTFRDSSGVALTDEDRKQGWLSESGASCPRAGPFF